MISNTKISATEEEVLQGEPVVKVESAERHHAMVNFWRTTLSCVLGTLFWLWTGWTSGNGAMVMIAVVTSLAMRLPNPRMSLSTLSTVRLPRCRWGRSIFW